MTAQEQLNALLGVAPAQAIEETLESLPHVALDKAKADIEALLALVDAAPEAHRVAALLGGLAALVHEARAEGPAIVSHLANQIYAHAIARLTPAESTAQ